MRTTRTTLALATLLTTLIGVYASGLETDQVAESRPGEVVQPAEVAPSERILWADEEKTSPIFLPERFTQGRTTEELPLGRFDREHLDWVLGNFRSVESSYECGTEPNEHGSGLDPKPLIDLLVAKKVVFTGKIEKVVSGWSPWRLGVVEMAYIRVERVVRGREVVGAPVPGELLAIQFVGGEAVVDGTRVCSSPREGYYRPVRSDRVLVGGQPWSHDPNFFYSYLHLPIKDGLVLPQPFMHLRVEERPHDLDRLLHRVAREEEIKQ